MFVTNNISVLSSKLVSKAVDFWRLGVNILVDLLICFLTSMVHCMSGISFGCIVWCPSDFTCLPGLESCPLGRNGLFHMFIPPPGFTTPTVWPSCATYLLSPVLMLFHIYSVVPSATPAAVLTCKLKTSWKWLLVWGSLSFQTLRREVNLRLDFGSTSILMSHTRSWCCRATSSPGITFTSVKSLRMVLQKRMNICVAIFPDLYVMRWLSRFLKHVFPRSRSNAKAYSRILSPSLSGSGLPYPNPQCTSLYPVPAWPTWLFQSPHWIRNSDAGILAVTAHSWSKNRSLTSSLRPLCGAYTDRKVTTCWPTMSFTKMILSETLWTSKTFSIHSSATNTPTPSVPLSFPDQKSLYLVSLPLIVR